MKTASFLEQLRFCRRQKKKNETEETKRRLRANDRHFNEQYNYADNFIRTSKYNLISFAPKNLFEQFQRIANFYFLLLMILQLIPWVSSIVWYSTAIPLFFVLSVSAGKDAYDDIQRHRSDNHVNNRILYVVRNGQLEKDKWMNVKVGEVVRMELGHYVAADLLLLSTSEPHGLCYVETAELDGETNLKAKQALPETTGVGDSLELISRFSGIGDIHCEAPNNRLNTFEGRITVADVDLPLDNDNLLLRGFVLRNTRWCYGLVLFAGLDTKLMMNSGKNKFKRTSLDHFLNVLIMGIVLFLIAMCLICAILCGIWEWTTGRMFTMYLEWDLTIIPDVHEKNPRQISIIAFLMFFSYMILLNTVVPISLYVSVEIIRFMHSWWINWDREMYYAKGDVAPQARTTTLNEELGQVQYIFSDKTGTLTRNIMVFNKCSINGRLYGDIFDERGQVIQITDSTEPLDFSSNPWYEKKFRFYDPTLQVDVQRNNKEVCEFWRLISLCHTIMPDMSSGSLEYQAQSPDEEALVSAARNFGFVFVARTPNSITIEVCGQTEIYELLCILDFNNFRKRMSVIVRNSAGRIKLYCKGADTMIIDRISINSRLRLKAITNDHLDQFADTGLRTLCLAHRDLDERMFKEWSKKQKAAAVSLQDRQSRLDEVYEEIETNMELLGASAVEDKLQDGVPEAIARLTDANIRIWVLTGDKQETAINIGYSCRLLTNDLSEVFVINGDQQDQVEVQLKNINRKMEQFKSAQGGSCSDDNAFSTTNVQCSSQNPAINIIFSNHKSWSESAKSEPAAEDDNFALVINGHSLSHALSPSLERQFLQVACLCRSVVCCRVTPLQKAMVVDLVKRNRRAVTLSVGDGANDVSMIKTAHIGVGISGQEGYQAVLASDFSIGQFRFLERLLLVHGRWSYLRMTKFLRYFFYKNFTFTLAHFWYAFFCGYSAQTVYDPAFIACYNLFFTSLPVLALGIFDQDVDDVYSTRCSGVHFCLSAIYPKLYIPGQFNLFFNMRIFIYSVLHGMISSLVLFFVSYFTLHYSANYQGLDMNDYPILAFTVFSALVVVVTVQIALDTCYWTVFNHIVVWGSLVFYFLLAVVIYQLLPFWLVSSSQSSHFYGVAFRALTSWHYWLNLMLIVVVLVMPVVGNRFFWSDTHPSYAHRLRVRQQWSKTPTKSSDVPLGRMSRRGTTTARARKASIRSGYAFSHQQGFGELITKGKFWSLLPGLPENGSKTGVTVDRKSGLFDSVMPSIRMTAGKFTPSSSSSKLQNTVQRL